MFVATWQWLLPAQRRRCNRTALLRKQVFQYTARKGRPPGRRGCARPSRPRAAAARGPRSRSMSGRRERRRQCACRRPAVSGTPAGPESARPAGQPHRCFRQRCKWIRLAPPSGRACTPPGCRAGARERPPPSLELEASAPARGLCRRRCTLPAAGADPAPRGRARGPRRSECHRSATSKPPRPPRSCCSRGWTPGWPYPRLTRSPIVPN
mmetsp:Transcript_54634/g.157099  ORF Transcript_54634/g.157099 Transcript_54634/m.157099 type:complete len:210 (+) Transcript_54634:550-1179(+)